MDSSQKKSRFASLTLVPPATGTPWTCAPTQSFVRAIKRVDGVEVPIRRPLFWYDPPWHWVDVDSADVVARAVAQYGIPVSLLQRDVAGYGSTSAFHSAHFVGEESVKSADSCALQSLPRIVPYRPERYGLVPSDFDGATIIDVRLTVARDETGRFAYSPEQIARWEATADDQPLAGGGWVPAATFPPDVQSLAHLSSKLGQIRELSPNAAVFVSMSPYRLDQELPQVIKQQPDGVILRADDDDLDGLAIAAMTRRARQWMKHEGVPELPLWIVPGEITADDAVKLIALGASGVAIDDWCDPILDKADEAQLQTNAARMGFKTSRSTQDPALIQWVKQQLDETIERFDGLSHSISHTAINESLASLDAVWSKALGVPHVTFGNKA
ncbi:hypothetical protein Poly51_14000 [Rubripirellula tenax]|uniref:Uncharacterized protein n=1 Tax=Rubripirellula tenax TaxID=2528015 RepID=A0A5C6FG98_9BACT|nr:hypothetical protein [Rubripirellula tenax]TWU58621.1 hypothetical protein Poly51_14000 [Rubripirellula tenax]